MPWTDKIYQDSDESVPVRYRYDPNWHGISNYNATTKASISGRTSLRILTVLPNPGTVNWNDGHPCWDGKYLWFGQKINTTLFVHRMDPQTLTVTTQQITVGAGSNTPYQCIYNPADGKIYLNCNYGAGELISIDPSANPWTVSLVSTYAASLVGSLGCIANGYFWVPKYSYSGGSTNMLWVKLSNGHNGSFLLGGSMVGSYQIIYDGTTCFVAGANNGTADGMIATFVPNDADVSGAPTVTRYTATGLGTALIILVDGNDGNLYCSDDGGDFIIFNKTTHAFSDPITLSTFALSPGIRLINGYLYYACEDITNKVGHVIVYNLKNGNYRLYESGMTLHGEIISIINTGKHNWVFTYDSDHTKPFAIYRMSAQEPAL